MRDEKHLSPVSQERIEEKPQKPLSNRPFTGRETRFGKTQNTQKRLPRKHENTKKKIRVISG